MTLPGILIVDDKPENLRVLTGVLEEHGFEVRPVTSGAQALAAIEGAPPDLVLLDIGMPEMDGLSVCRELRRRPETLDVPVIFLTAFGDAAHKSDAFRAGGVDYITKPFQVEEVLARVRVHLDLRRARLELAAKIARLEALERLRDDLVHMIVHDMRSPLTVAQGYLEMLENELAGSNKVAATRRAVARVTRMANDLLDVSRMEQGELPLAKEHCELSALARQVCDALRPPNTRHTLAVEAAEDAAIECDPGLIRRVLENLVSNAIKYMPAGGRITVHVARTAAGASVAVVDEGPGVPAASVGRIFEKFGSTELRRDGGVHSVGLGLPFCKLAVETHRGTIGVTAGPSGGSRFWFDLPR